MARSVDTTQYIISVIYFHQLHVSSIKAIFRHFVYYQLSAKSAYWPMFTLSYFVVLSWVRVYDKIGV